jgi:parvulin-like peptidyl-prolyl isomerase
MLLVASTAMAQKSDPTLATYGSSKVAASDYEASILRIPERDRFGWAMSQERINKEIENLLRTRAVANEGRRQSLDADPSIRKRIELYADRLVAEAVMTKLDAESTKEFEAKKSVFVDRAREQYLINKQNYQTKPEVRVSHLLITTRGRTPEEALALTQSLRKKIVDGASFEDIAVANSEDASVKRNKGDLGFFEPGQMDPAFEHAAFAMKNPGELSEPVRSRFGYHLILLHERKEPRQISLEEATPELMEKLKAEFLDTKRSQFLKNFYDPAKIEWNEPAVAALRKTVDPAVIKQLTSQIQ